MFPLPASRPCDHIGFQCQRVGSDNLTLKFIVLMIRRNKLNTHTYLLACKIKFESVTPGKRKERYNRDLVLDFREKKQGRLRTAICL